MLVIVFNFHSEASQNTHTKKVIIYLLNTCLTYLKCKKKENELYDPRGFYYSTGS